jgi:hypothetical protein
VVLLLGSPYPKRIDAALAVIWNNESDALRPSDVGSVVFVEVDSVVPL